MNRFRVPKMFGRGPFGSATTFVLRRGHALVFGLALTLFFAGRPMAAQEPAQAETPRENEVTILDDEGYLSPPEEIREALLAPWHQNVELEDIGPTGRFFVIEEEAQRMPSLAGFAKKHYYLGGLQVDPLANRSRRFTVDGASGLRLLSPEDGREFEVEAPDDAKLSTPRWAPDGSRLAFFAHFEDATHIYVAEPESGDAERLTSTPVLATLVTNFEWSGDGRYIFTLLVPEERGPEPAEPGVAETPRIWMTRPQENQLRTFPSLLETPHEFALLEHYTTGQLARIEVESGDVEPIGEPAMIDLIDPAPGGEYVRVRTVDEPFSDIVPVNDFATVEEVWNLEGEALAEVTSEPVDDGRDDDDDEEEDEEGRRFIAWRPDGQGLSFVEREPQPEEEEATEPEDEDEEDEDQQRPDRVMQWLPPFEEGAARVVHEAEHRIRGVAYSADGARVFVTTRDGEEEHLYTAALDGSSTADTIYRWDTEDYYTNPGTLMRRPGPRGGTVVRLSPDGGSVYLSGTLHHENPLEQAPQPFIDRVTIESGEKTRIFESAADRYEEVAAVLDDAFQRVVLERESATEVANFFVRDLASGDERQLTQNRDYTPDLTSRAQRHVLEVERADGVTFWVHVTLPADYEPGTRLPAMFWHYPREYESEEDYDEGNRDYNKNSFPGISPRSMEHLLRRGWAVVEPDVPIIGPSRERWNDYYVLHLRNSLAAAIDALDERGWIDRSRLAIGGHSYGGFGTINSLIHTPFFKAGIAGASNTNRSLTPAGFQREPRTLWEGRETYIRMSPMFWLNELSGALLMYHDMEDQNVGTFPVNSWRAFHGLNALGKTAALYMYPYEAHGPRAQETILDLWTRWVAWLDTHVLGTDTEQRVAEDATSEEG